MSRDNLSKFGPISESAIKNSDRIAKEQGNHATVEVSDDHGQKSLTGEAGGSIEREKKPPITWTAYAKKVWKGPLIAGSTWRW